jgi:hypothetical protein
VLLLLAQGDDFGHQGVDDLAPHVQVARVRRGGQVLAPSTDDPQVRGGCTQLLGVEEGATPVALTLGAGVLPLREDE